MENVGRFRGHSAGTPYKVQQIATHSTVYVKSRCMPLGTCRTSPHDSYATARRLHNHLNPHHVSAAHRPHTNELARTQSPRFAAGRPRNVTFLYDMQQPGQIEISDLPGARRTLRSVQVFQFTVSCLSCAREVDSADAVWRGAIRTKNGHDEVDSQPSVIAPPKYPPFGQLPATF